MPKYQDDRAALDRAERESGLRAERIQQAINEAIECDAEFYPYGQSNLAEDVAEADSVELSALSAALAAFNASPDNSLCAKEVANVLNKLTRTYWAKQANYVAAKSEDSR